MPTEGPKEGEKDTEFGAGTGVGRQGVGDSQDCVDRLSWIQSVPREELWEKNICRCKIKGRIRS